jgi:hypothetical protein
MVSHDQSHPRQIVHKTTISKITRAKWTGGMAQSSLVCFESTCSTNSRPWVQPPPPNQLETPKYWYVPYCPPPKQTRSNRKSTSTESSTTHIYSLSSWWPEFWTVYCGWRRLSELPCMVLPLGCLVSQKFHIYKSQGPLLSTSPAGSQCMRA